MSFRSFRDQLTGRQQDRAQLDSGIDSPPVAARCHDAETRAMKTNTTSGSAPVALAELARLPANSVLDQLGVTRLGLSETVAQERMEQYGENKVAHEAPPTWYVQLAHAFWNPFIGVLLALGVLSYLTGDIRAVIVISVMVTISALLRFFQEFRASQAALALQAIVTTRSAVEPG